MEKRIVRHRKQLRPGEAFTLVGAYVSFGLRTAIEEMSDRRQVPMSVVIREALLWGLSVMVNREKEDRRKMEQNIIDAAGKAQPENAIYSLGNVA